MKNHQKSPSAERDLHRRNSRPATSAVRLLAFAIPVALLFLTAGSALAKDVHVYSHSFGSGELSLTVESGLGIDQESGEVYVADTGSGRIAKFTAAGAADGTLVTVNDPSFVAVDNSGGLSAGDVYVVGSSNSLITKFDPAGAILSKFEGLGEIGGIAVDQAGNLWVYNDQLVMREFSPSGAKLAEFTSPFFNVAKIGIAVDSADNLYVARAPGNPTPAKISKTGQELAFNFGSTAPAAGLAVDEADDNVYISGAFPGVGAAVQGIERMTPTNSPVESFGAEGESGELQEPAAGLAVRASTGDVYAAETISDEVNVYSVKNVEAPPVTIGTATAITSTSAHLSGAVNPNGSKTTCEFQYTLKSTYDARLNEGKDGFGGAKAIPCSTSPGSGNTTVPVEAELEGLTAGQTYEIRLAATNVGGTGFSGKLEPSLKATESAPSVSGEFVDAVDNSSATLHAVVVSHGASTNYQFEYLPESAFLAEGFDSGQTVTIPAASPLPGDAEPHEVSAQVTELNAAAGYVFRISASNLVGAALGEPFRFTTRSTPATTRDDCPNAVFRNGHGSLLPDCRAYELASPIEKGGLPVEGLQDIFAAASDGSAVRWYSQGGSGFPAGEGGHQTFLTLLSSRSAESWATQRLLPPESFGSSANFLGASPDQRYAVVEAVEEGTGPGTGRGLFVIDTATHSVSQLVAYEANQVGAPGFAQGPGRYSLAGISQDGSAIFFETESQLSPVAAAGKNNVFVWRRDTGQVSVAGVLPGKNGKAPPGGSFGGAYAWFMSSDLSHGGAAANQYVEALHAISPTGEQIYFTAGGTGQLYLRRKPGKADATTVLVSAPAANVTDPNGTKPAAFQEATPDGSKAFFVSAGRLTADSNTGPTDEGSELYRWDSASDALVDVSAGLEGPKGGQVKGLLGVSADGSSGYFVALGKRPGGTEAEGAYNLYRFIEDEAGSFSLTFIAELSNGSGSPSAPQSDARNWSPQSRLPGAISQSETLARTSRVTPDGRILLFSSRASLTGYRAPGCNSGNCAELFRYSAPSPSALDGDLTCISCNPTGERPTGNAELTSVFLNAHLTPEASVEAMLTRNMTPDGGRVFFMSPDPLVAEDTNGSPTCTFYKENNSGHEYPDCVDVYEWESPGAPKSSCQSPGPSGGCLYLLSTGKSSQMSAFVDASTDGSSAFIATDSSLVPADQDELYDVYDVRADGGLAAQQTRPAAPCESSASCLDPVAGASAADSPGSSSFQGPGNVHTSPRKRCQKASRKKCGKKGKRNHPPRGHSQEKRKHKDHRQQSFGGTK